MARITDPVLGWTSQTEGGRRRWRLLEPLNYGVESAFGPTWLQVPAGFEFDLASIPRPVFWLFGWAGFRPDSVHPAGPCVHDWLYRNGGKVDVMVDEVMTERQFTREEADDMFRQILIATGTPKWRANVMHTAVRAGGWKGWQG